MKKFFLVLISLPVLLIILLFGGYSIKNNIVLNNFAKQIYNCNLPDKTKLIECKKTCGKLNGNGNGMDYFACILIKSDLSFKELKKYYSRIKFKPADNESKSSVYPEIFKVKDFKIDSEYLENKKLIFESLKKKKIFQKYYYIIIYDGGYSAGFDFRGN
jgi:hypothetical protein